MAWLAPLRQRPFLFMWLGQTTSRLGDAVYAIALDWLILQQTHSATAVGVVLIIALLPTLLLLLIGGVVADRLPRLQILLASDLIRGGPTLALTLLAVRGTVPFWAIVGINFGFSLTRACFAPAYRKSAKSPRRSSGGCQRGRRSDADLVSLW